MGSSSSSHALLLMAVLLLLGVASSTRSSPLKVANNLKHGPLTVLTPPGCCSPCEPGGPGLVCADVCSQCRDVVVEQGRVGMLDRRTGPYPLPFLMIQVKAVVWCVDSADLWMLKESVTLVVGPRACGPYNRGLKAYAFVLHDERPSRGMNLCLYVCNRD